MGESASLDLDERRRITGAIVEAASGRVPVIAGIAATTARVATTYALAAQEAGATSLMMLPPLNYNGDFAEIAGFFEASVRPPGCRSWPTTTPSPAASSFRWRRSPRLGNEVESVVAIKECSGETRNIAAIIGATGDDFEVIVGGDDLALEGFCAGATGWVSGVANVIPADCVKLYDPAVEGDLGHRARDLPADAAAGPTGLRPQARPVLQGRDGSGGPARRACAGSRAGRSPRPMRRSWPRPWTRWASTPPAPSPSASRPNRCRPRCTESTLAPAGPARSSRNRPRTSWTPRSPPQPRRPAIRGSPTPPGAPP